MRTALGFAFEAQVTDAMESTTFAALGSAVVDALLSAGGIFEMRDSLADLSFEERCKKVELRLHYDGHEIQNIDVNVFGQNRVAPAVLQSFKETLCRLLFLEADRVTVKAYHVPETALALQVQAAVLIG